MLPIVVVMTIQRIDDDDDGCDDDQKFMTAPCQARAASKSPSASETVRRCPVARCSLIRREAPQPETPSPETARPCNPYPKSC